MGKVYKFPDLVSVYHWLTEVRQWDSEMEEIAEQAEEDENLDAVTMNAKIREFQQQIDSNLLLIAHELIPEETKNVGDLQDFIMGLIFEDMSDHQIVRSVLDARKELLAQRIIQ